MSSGLRFAAIASLLSACGREPAHRPEPLPIVETEAPAANATVAPTPSAPPKAAELPVSEGFSAKIVLEKEVAFLIAGESRRLAVLAKDGASTVPHRFEHDRWEALELPEPLRTADPAKLGIYFGRDNRPRLMGFQGQADAARMVYLRFKDGSWQDQRSELGGLASDSAALFGVLGERDPEVVCKVGLPTCLLKSRKGWKDVKSSLPPTAVVRAFLGKGYALTSEGVFRADDAGFTRVGPPPPWKTPATGFWVGEGDIVAVVEPALDRIYTLPIASGAWVEQASPIAGPRDITGPTAERWLAGDGGLAVLSAQGPKRVGSADLSFSRVIQDGNRVVAGGRSGVLLVTPQ